MKLTPFKPTYVNEKNVPQDHPGEYVLLPLSLFESLITDVEALLEARTLTDQANAVVELSNDTSDAKSWHPDYNVDTGEFWSEEE